jgi:hypothetical protein
VKRNKRHRKEAEEEGERCAGRDGLGREREASWAAGVVNAFKSTFMSVVFKHFTELC